MRSFLEVGLLLLIPILQISSSCDADDWRTSRETHKPRSLTVKRMRRLASLSDMRQFNDTLKPFLTVRVSGTPENTLVQQHIISKMKALKWTVETDLFRDRTPFGDKEFTNIVATHNPSARRRLVLACHFDSKFFPSFTFTAATDSAVPCAMMIDAAEKLDKPLRDSLANTGSCPASDVKCSLTKGNDLTIQMIFFDGEEAFQEWTATDSIYGARHLSKKYQTSKHPRDDMETTNMLDTIDVLVLLDLIGYKNPTFHSWFHNTEKKFDKLRIIEKKLYKEGLLKRSAAHRYFKQQVTYGAIEDDHKPFLELGVPIIHLIAYPFPPVWHTVNDNEANLDVDSIDDLNKILRQYVVEYLSLAV